MSGRRHAVDRAGDCDVGGLVAMDAADDDDPNPCVRRVEVTAVMARPCTDRPSTTTDPVSAGSAASETALVDDRRAR
jgi:hypothetical protein